MSASPRCLDFAGVDGQEVAQALFGEQVSRLSVWQSLDTDRNGTSCSVLRLCQGNYRVGAYGGDADALGQALSEAAHGKRVWVKPCGLSSLIAQDAPELLLPVATVKPPHRLAGLPGDHAVPARLGDCAVLLWRHTVTARAVLEVQTAAGDFAAVRETLCQARLL